ncbi:MAG: winged helix-turn-helix transcriptional regulator [Gammaproteobacteria bacterium TMED134]|nr:MAG: winged helix-turn-helix transcriptional regulator [Gammaproteobacteria bacterium TMED134]
MTSLDRIDRRILATLQRDGRLSNVKLAQTVNLSPTPCLERVKRLEQAGYIEGYKAQLNAVQLKQGFLAFITISLDRVTTDVLEAFSAQARRLPEIVECHMVGGGFDFLIKVRTENMASFRRFLGEGLATLPEVATTSTYFVMEQVVSTGDIQVDQG